MSKARKKWHETLYTYVWVFNTERGLCVSIRFPHNIGVVYDLGRSNEFSPISFIEDNIAPCLNKCYNNASIAQCFLSHPHTDHISDIVAVSDESRKVYPHLLTCPNDKADDEAVDFSRLENEDNKIILEKYRESYSKRNLPLQTLNADTAISYAYAPNVEYGFYYVRPPRVAEIHEADDHLYGNGLSLVLYLRHGNQSLLIPGDVTPDVMKEILAETQYVEKRYTKFSKADASNQADWHLKNSSQPSLKDLLSQRGLSVLIAPHHGLESCYSEELFKAIRDNKPMLNVISEKRHLSESDGRVDARYQSEFGASGLKVDIDGSTEKRYSVSTREGHHILIIFRGTDGAPHVYLRKEPSDLLDIS